MTALRKSLKSFLLGIFIFLGGFLVSVMTTGETVSSPQVKALEANPPLVPKAGEIHGTFTTVAQDVRPAVVFIKTKRARQSRSGRQESYGPFDFFRDFGPDDERPRRGGGGSGFIIDSEGRILTNEHVIRDADEITVVLGVSPDKEEFEATVVGFDTHTDIAVIQIDAERDWPTVTLGDSDEMLEGDWVMAIGTPFGQLAGTVTVGVISAKGRSDLRIMGGQADYQNYIQTDASINFGNSGGPLVNLRGEAIGINTAINPSGQGIGFAIPINMAKNISNQLIARGRVQYGFMGIRLQELTREIASGRDMDVDSGILVLEVLPDTPAERAGLKRNDVIVEYDGETVRDDSRFRLMVGNTEVGREVPLKVVREGRVKDMRITLVERQDDVLASVPAQVEGWLGMQVDEVNSPDASAFEISRSQDGVVVIDVVEGSPASEAGIQAGDVITEVYSQKVSNLREYMEISEKLKERKEPIAFLVQRGRTSTYVPVIPDKD